MIKKILILIVDYQSQSESAELSTQLVEAYLSEKNLNYTIQVIHVDNGNSPAVQITEKQRKLGIEVLATGQNLGYAGAINFAIRERSEKRKEIFDAYWFLNSDLEVAPYCLTRLVQVLDSQPQIGAIGPIVRDYYRRNRVWGARGRVSPLLGTTAMTDWKSGGLLPKWSYIPGCSLLTRATAYQEAEGLPERYKLYFEETEFCVRLQRLGWNLWVEKDASAYHKVHSLKAGIPARHFAYYFTRNHLAFWKICFGIPIWIQFPRTLYVVCREVLLPLRRAKDLQEIRDRLKYVWAGLLDGILFALNWPLRYEKKLWPQN